MPSPYRILLTPGEPAGIGPDICARLATKSGPWNQHALIAPYSKAILEERANLLGLPLQITEIDSIDQAQPLEAGYLHVLPLSQTLNCTPGVPNTNSRPLVLDMLNAANDLCLAKQADAIVTAPIAKHLLATESTPFSGHTEFFAEKSSVDQVVMLLATKGLRVALATTHIPLWQVPNAITQDGLSKTLEILLSGLKQQWGIQNPDVRVTGLNPHAGENGTLGTEEIATIIPVLEKFQAKGEKISGPYPADTLFVEEHLQGCDAVLAMYHDQGLPVLKAKGFRKALNITLGLPYLRTSVDHGTAFELAGTGKADSSSLEYAVSETIKILDARHGA